MHGERKHSRNVIPRWRSLRAIDGFELSSTGKFETSTHQNVLIDLADHLVTWRSENTLASAVDIFDASILIGDQDLLKESLTRFERHTSALPPRLLESIERAAAKPFDRLDFRRKLAFRETDVDYLRHSIRVLKAYLSNNPRNALSHLEIARVYCILGEFDRTERHLFMARTLAPDDRVIIRSTIQFYDIVQSLEEGLMIVRQTERLRYDPWIQSAEIAVATLLGKSSKAANRNLLKLDKKGNVPRHHTELAMAMATLERQSGLRERKVFQIVGSALPQATENGFAQAIWLSEKSSRAFKERFPNATPTSEAYEAKVQLAVDRFEFVEASGFAELWLEDQPFSKDALVRYLNISSVHLAPTDSVVRSARRALQIHGDDWGVLNAVLLALTEAGYLSDAETALRALDRAAPSGSPRSFVEAARGFLAFARGDFLLGRSAYESAVTLSKQLGTYDLVVNAFMFWLRCEAKNGLLSQSVINEMTTVIERAFSRISLSQKPFLQGIWFSVKRHVEEAHPIGEDDLSSSLHRLALNNLEEAPLLI